MVISHTVGAVAPVTKTTTYGTVSNIPGEPSKCWITSNLGADQQATAVNDDTEASAGWYWQFNKQQGYKHDGTIRTPNYTWITSIEENSEWLSANDPCSIEIGFGWRLPTNSEWTNVVDTGGWNEWNGPWNSELKIHGAGFVHFSDGLVYDRGLSGDYWSSSQANNLYGSNLVLGGSLCYVTFSHKANAFTIRCIRDN